MITPHYFKEVKIKIFNPDGTFLCEANEDTLNDLRVQIAENKLEGYTYEFEDKKGIINSNGQLSEWFYGMFDLMQIFFASLFRIQRGEKNNLKENEVYKKLLNS